MYIQNRTVYYQLVVLITKQHLFFCYPDACVRGKHSAWMSAAPNRADARTHYQQRNGAHKSLPPGGRWHAVGVPRSEWNELWGFAALRDGRRPRDFRFSQLSLYRTLPQSLRDSSLPEGAFRKTVANRKTPPKKIPWWC